FHTEFSAMRVNQCLGNCKTEAETSKTTGDRDLPLLEGVEDLVDPFRLDAHPGIDNPDVNLLRRGVECLDGNATFFGSKLHAVLDQIPKDLLQARRIAFDMCISGTKMKFHFEMFGGNVLAANLVSALENLVHTHSLKAQL